MLFQETLRESGLNQYLFAMTNIRDQCSWVHRNDPAAATEKATDLMRMAVARARNLKALGTGKLPVVQTALVLGGGLAGMTTALALADQGFAVHLCEKEAVLGGQLHNIHFTLEGSDVAGYLNDLVARVQKHPKITLHLQTTPVQITGHVGNFKTRVNEAGKEQTIPHGVIVLAVGGSERQTELYLNGKHPAVVTQRQLEDDAGEEVLSRSRVATGGDDPVRGQSQRQAPLLQSCVLCGSHQERARIEKAAAQGQGRRSVQGHPHLRLPRAGLSASARSGRAVRPLRDKQDPRGQRAKAACRSAWTTPATAANSCSSPTCVVLSTGIAPAADNPALSGLLRSALTADGFFLEAHPKLRPVDLANEGEFLAGLAHSPRFIDETIAQAKAAAGRAATVLSRAYLDIAGQVAKVDPTNCVACATCVKACPYGAPMINDLKKAEIQGAKCMGCGSCAAACPAHTITLQHQECSQMTAMLDELLVNEGAAQ